MFKEPYVRIGHAGTVEIVVFDANGQEVSMPTTCQAAVKLANDLLIAATVQSSSPESRPTPGSVFGDGYVYVKSWQTHVASHGHEGFILHAAPGEPIKFLLEPEKLKSFARQVLA